jgi:type IV secretory pathway TraG/TraD family ATPase VirD4
MSKTQSYIQLTPTNPTDQFPVIVNYLKSPTGMTILFTLVAMWLLRDNNNKGKLATGRWGGVNERRAAKKIALKQIKNPRKNACSLYINTPASVKKKLKSKLKFPVPHRSYIQKLVDNSKKLEEERTPITAPTYYIPDTQQSISVVGSAGSGKTYSAIDPLLRSAIDQGHSTIVYDFKYPGQSKDLALYARRRGYKVYIFAPGYGESRALNLLDFIKDSKDAIGASQLAEVIVKNCSNKNSSGGDEFFTSAGMGLVEGLFLITKWIGEYCEDPSMSDLLTAACIINLPNLAARIQYAQINSDLSISRWTLQSFAQLVSTHGNGEGNEANKTETSIVATAQDVFKKFIRRDFIGSFCQKSNLPVDVDEKVLVIFGLNQVNRYSIGPLLAASLHMMISNNIIHSKPRKSPLIVGLDELPSAYFPALANWLAEARSAGFNAILGFQNFRQLQETYGENLAQIIFGNTATKFIFNPGEFDSAETISKSLGQVEVNIKSKSVSTGKGGRSTSTSNQLQTKALLAPEELLKFDRGKAVVISSGYRSKKEAFIPQQIEFKISQDDLDEVNYLSSKWGEWVDYLNQTTPQLTDEELDEMFEERALIVEQLFPEPPRAEVETLELEVGSK